MTKLKKVNERNYYTIDEIAQKLGLHYSTIYIDIISGKLKAHKVPQRAGWRIKKTDAAPYIRSRIQ